MNQVFNHTTTYHHNDVLCGRGRYIREHSGNIQFISLVKELKSDYVAARKSEKRAFADFVVRQIRSLNPPGRFLKRCHVTNQWVDIGDRQAVAKARQALREGAPHIVKQLQNVKIKTQQGVFADINGLMTSEVCEECPSQTNTDEGKKIPGVSQDMCERHPSCGDRISNDIQPIPLQKSTVTVKATRDDATKLLRILGSDEPCPDVFLNTHQNALTNYSHEAKGGSEESTGTKNDEEVVQLQQPQQQPSQIHYDQQQPLGKATMPLGTIEYRSRDY